MSEDIKDLLEKKKAEKEAIYEATGPMRAEMEEIYNKIRPLEVKAREIAVEIKSIEQPKLSVLDREIAGLSKALGGKSLSGV